MQLCFLISALSGSEKSKEIFWVVERLNFDSFLNSFEFNKLNNVQLRGHGPRLFKIDRREMIVRGSLLKTDRSYKL